jgi:hypothetical protein
MDFKLEREVDKGPIVRWIANKVMSLSGSLAKLAHPYADMYTAVWDDYEDEDNLSVPHNQMGLFEDLEVLPQFERLAEDLI